MQDLLQLHHGHQFCGLQSLAKIQELSVALSNWALKKWMRYLVLIDTYIISHHLRIGDRNQVHDQHLVQEKLCNSVAPAEVRNYNILGKTLEVHMCSAV
jgi:hypothetical protein